jgi:hypothetical protein
MESRGAGRRNTRHPAKTGIKSMELILSTIENFFDVERTERKV